MAQELVVKIVGDSTSLDRAMKKGARSARTFDRSLRGSTLSVKGMHRSLLGMSSALLGGAGLVVGLRAVARETSEMQKVAAQTNAVIKSTGGIAGVSAKHVEELGTSLFKLSGIDDEVIKSSANLLLTFTNIRNVTGEGNDVFDQAALAALNLSVRFGRDLTGSAITLGKALQDPNKGLLALRRSGIQFSEAQQKTIKALVASGKLLEAQQVILAEVERQTKGAAEAYGDTLAGSLNKVRENMLNLAGAVATSLLPVLEPLVDQAVAWLENTRNQKTVIDRVTSAVRTLGSVIGRLADIGKVIAEAVGGWKNAIAGLVGAWVGFKVAGIVAAQQVMFANILAAHGTAAAWKAALISTGFGALVVAAGTAAALVIVHWEKVKVWFQEFWLWLRHTALRAALHVVEPFSHIPSDRLGGWARDLKTQVLADLGEIEAAATRLAQGLPEMFVPPGPRGPVGRPAATAVGGAAPPGTVSTAAERRKRLRGAAEAARQAALARASFAVERAAATAMLSDDLAALNKYNALLLRRIRGGHATLELEREQFSVQQQIADILKEQAEAQKAARTARQFRLLGFGPQGEDLIPGVSALKRQLAAVDRVLEGSFLDTKKTRSLIAHIRQVLSGGLGSVAEEVRSKIQQILADLKQQLRSSSVDVTRFQKTARGQFALAGAAGGARGVVITGGVHLHGIRNAEQMERELTKRQRQRARQRRSKR